MSDLKLTFYVDDLIEGTEEHDMVRSITNDHERMIEVLGCSYTVTDVIFEGFSGKEIWPTNRNKITIKAMKMIPVHFPPEKEVDREGDSEEADRIKIMPMSPYYSEFD